MENWSCSVGFASGFPIFGFARRIRDVDSLTHGGSLEHGRTATEGSRPFLNQFDEGVHP
jgi:hypothetical protein